MGMWSEWHSKTREIGGWIHIITSPSGRVRRAGYHMYQYTNPRVMLCHSDHRPNALTLLYHTSWCTLKHQHISLKFINNVTLIWLPAAGCVRRWLLWCFESRACAAVVRAAIFIVVRYSQCVSDIMLKWKMKSWTVTRVIVWLVWSWRRS